MMTHSALGTTMTWIGQLTIGIFFIAGFVNYYTEIQNRTFRLR